MDTSEATSENAAEGRANTEPISSNLSSLFSPVLTNLSSSSPFYNETSYSDLYLPCTETLLKNALLSAPEIANSTSFNDSNKNCSWICSYDADYCENVSSLPSFEDPSNTGDGLQYGLWLSILIAVLIGLCSLLTIAGNILVILAFVFERAIRQPSNYFIASLAVSDMMIGCVSMPFFAVYTIVGKWTMGNLACDLWLAADYTVCLVSIYTVLLITVDRYCSVKIAARYRSWRTKNKVLMMVSVTWIVPALVFFVSIMGWDFFQGYRDLKPDECEVQFLKNKIFNTALIFGYFYSSLTIMLILYAGIYKTARDMHRKTAAKHKKMQMLVAMNKSNAKPSIAMSKTQSTLLSQDKPNQTAGAANQANQNPKHSDQQNTSSSSRAGSKNFDKKDGSDQDRSSSPIFESDEEIAKPDKDKHVPKPKKNTNKSSKGIFATSNKLRKEPKSSKASSKPVSKLEMMPRRRTNKTSPASFDQNQTCILDTENIMSPVEDKDGELNHHERSNAPPSTLDVKPCVIFESQQSPAQRSESKSAVPSADATTIPESNTMVYIDQETSTMSPVDVHSVVQSATEPSPRSPVPLTNKEDSETVVPGALTPSPSSAPPRRPSRPSQGSISTISNTVIDAMASEKVQTELKATSLGHKYQTQVVKPSELTSGTKSPPTVDALRNKGSSRQIRKDLVASIGKRSKRKRRKGDAEKRQTSKSENRARKALRTISFIMGAFVLCWTPYHILALIEGFCTVGRCTGYYLFYFTYFLCYLNSPLNPFCYAMANQQFKKTFARILRGDFHRT